jgi:hypothetical protein
MGLYPPVIYFLRDAQRPDAYLTCRCPHYYSAAKISLVPITTYNKPILVCATYKSIFVESCTVKSIRAPYPGYTTKRFDLLKPIEQTIYNNTTALNQGRGGQGVAAPGRNCTRRDIELRILPSLAIFT